MKQISKVLLVFFMALGSQVIQSSEGNDSFEKLSESIIDYKDNKLANLIAKVRAIQNYFKDLHVGSGSDAQYNADLRDKEAVKVKLCKIVGQDAFEEAEVGGKQIQICTASKGKLMRVTRKVHPDKVDPEIAQDEMPADMQGIFIRALQIAYKARYSGLLLALGQDPATFTIDTLYGPDEVGDSENASAVRIANLAKYILELFTKSFETVTKTEDPMQTVQKMIDAFNNYFGDREYEGSKNALKVGQLLNQLRRGELDLDGCDQARLQLQKLQTLCQNAEAGIASEYGRLVKLYPRDRFKERANRRVQGDVANVQEIMLPQLIDFVDRYKHLKVSQTDSSTGTQADHDEDLSDFKKLAQPFSRKTVKLLDLWEVVPVLQDQSVEFFSSILRAARDVVLNTANLLENSEGISPDEKAGYLVEFKGAIANLQTKILTGNFLSLFKNRAALNQYEDRVMAWIAAYKNILNYIMVEMYGKPAPFDEAAAAAQKILVDLSQTFLLVA